MVVPTATVAPISARASTGPDWKTITAHPISSPSELVQTGFEEIEALRGGEHHHASSKRT